MTDLTRIVLIRTSHPGNVGAAARAMKVMGLRELVLVQPRFPDVLVQEDTVAMASGAADILVRARIVDSLDAALDGVHLACATAMTPRDFGPPTAAPREHLPGLVPAARAGQRIAFVFGSERFGMSNDEVRRCQVCLSIPTQPDYGSLNLAQAVQLIAYEWRLALGGYPVVERTQVPVRATLDEVQGALEHWRGVLERIGYLDPAAPKKLMPRLQLLLDRAALTREEVHILRGIAGCVARSAESAPGRPSGRDPADTA